MKNKLDNILLNLFKTTEVKKGCDCDICKFIRKEVVQARFKIIKLFKKIVEEERKINKKNNPSMQGVNSLCDNIINKINELKNYEK